MHTDALYQVLKAFITNNSLADEIGQSFAFECDHLTASFFKGFFKPLEGFVILPQPGINTRDAERRNVLALLRLEQLVEDLVSLVAFAG